MKIRVLGAAAGGGFPQWNCNHPNSRRARERDPAAQQRTQSSIAVSSDGDHWFLFNASPDLRHQIIANDILHPKRDLRHSPIQGAVLTNADVDHIAGLLHLRESHPLRIYGTRRVLEVLKGNPVFNVLNPKFVARTVMPLDEPIELTGPDDTPSGIVVVPFAVPGKVALWLEDAAMGPNFGTVEEDTVALEVRDTDGATKFFYVPGCASMPEALTERLRGAPMVLFDGTLWRDDEMIIANVGVKTGNRMGHMSLSGDDGTIAAFENLDVARKVFIHINTTNPVLLDDSPERAKANAAGWEVSYDGMEIAL
ncbi:MAG: pyrroloquinoline quinone biosynthesis protein PqqB [Alphaproteobacteria bacterium]|jgi:pyrroloquinoline quinone biosynthesis protein B|nr:pyrroloquinoline quinone biosynthesis protein PqqB [Alphaproteobacteria bacterium]MDP6518177.1 pyrroloquinoline quinone biosynthesis protein PqqB [Alphaproteobacteria bacterium]